MPVRIVAGNASPGLCRLVAGLIGTGNLPPADRIVLYFDGGFRAPPDNLADWVETGTGVYVDQYNTGSSSSTNDTDDDGIIDGTEVDNRTDPNSSDTTNPTVVISYPTNNSEWVTMP